jgi:hypothetical protein
MFCMKNAVIAFILGITITVQAGQDGIIDLVMVDTGNRNEMSGILVMHKNENLPEAVKGQMRTHGTSMAESLADQIIRLAMQPVHATQIPYQTLDHYLSALDSAIEINPRVISLSLAGDTPMSKERALIEKACKRGILVLAASGNTHRLNRQYPASYGLPCLISISSIDDTGVIPDYANVGEAYIKLRYATERGTSYSTARAGAFALGYFRKYPHASAAQAKRWFIDHFPRPTTGSTQPAR